MGLDFIYREFIKQQLKEDLLKASQYKGQKLDQYLLHIKVQEELNDISDQDFIKVCKELIIELKGGKL